MSSLQSCRFTSFSSILTIIHTLHVCHVATESEITHEKNEMVARENGMISSYTHKTIQLVSNSYWWAVQKISHENDAQYCKTA